MKIHEKSNIVLKFFHLGIDVVEHQDSIKVMWLGENRDYMKSFQLFFPVEYSKMIDGHTFIKIDVSELTMDEVIEDLQHVLSEVISRTIFDITKLIETSNGIVTGIEEDFKKL